MKLKAITYTDDEELETVTVVMSLREATALHAIAGKLNGIAHRQLGLDGDDSLYDAIATLFNGHWDDGKPPNAPRIDLATLGAPLEVEQ